MKCSGFISHPILTRGHFFGGASSNPYRLPIETSSLETEGKRGRDLEKISIVLWFIQNSLDSKNMSIGLECLAGYPACLSLVPLEGKVSFGIATPERSSCLISAYVLFGLKDSLRVPKWQSLTLDLHCFHTIGFVELTIQLPLNKSLRTSMCFKTSDNEIVNFDCRNGIP